MYVVDWDAISAVATTAAVIVALGTTAFQEWRVQDRVRSGNAALHQGAVDTVRQGWIAVDDAKVVFYPAGAVSLEAAGSALLKVDRARRLIDLFVKREVDPKILIGLLQMDDHLLAAKVILTQAINAAAKGRVENAQFNGQLEEASSAAQLIVISIA